MLEMISMVRIFFVRKSPRCTFVCLDFRRQLTKPTFAEGVALETRSLRSTDSLRTTRKAESLRTTRKVEFLIVDCSGVTSVDSVGVSAVIKVGFLA